MKTIYKLTIRNPKTGTDYRRYFKDAPTPATILAAISAIEDGTPVREFPASQADWQVTSIEATLDYAGILEDEVTE